MDLALALEQSAKRQIDGNILSRIAHFCWLIFSYRTIIAFRSLVGIGNCISTSGSFPFYYRNTFWLSATPSYFLTARDFVDFSTIVP